MLAENLFREGYVSVRKRFGTELRQAGRALFFTVVAAALILAASGGASAKQYDQNYKVRPGDTLMVRIPAEPLLSGKFEVYSNGKFYFPVLPDIDLGVVEAVGKTVAEIEADIKARVSRLYTDDTVVVELVTLEAMEGELVSIYGELEEPGTLRLEQGMKLLNLLIRGGRLYDTADLHHASLYREGEIIYYDLADLVQGRDFTNNVELKAGDVLIVPSILEKTQIRVLVLGNVRNPGSFTLPEKTLVMEVIAKAGGPYGRAAVGKTVIIRLDEKGEPIVLHVDIKQMINKADLAQNVTIRDGDVVFVPETSRYDYMSAVSKILELNLLRRTLGGNDF